MHGLPIPKREEVIRMLNRFYQLEILKALALLLALLIAMHLMLE
jgi:hypothetical protein